MTVRGKGRCNNSNNNNNRSSSSSSNRASFACSSLSLSLSLAVTRHLVSAFLLLIILGGNGNGNGIGNWNGNASIRIISTANAFGLPQPLKVIRRDFEALTRRVTAYHILLPKSDDVALALKQSIRNKSSSSYSYQYQNQYASANANGSAIGSANGNASAEKEKERSKSKSDTSSDSDSHISSGSDSNINKMYIVDAFRQAATKYSRCPDTSNNGGLLGKRVPQGYCRAPELDRACFQVPLGEICGPIKSEYGYHLLLVEERTNCPKLDGPYTRIVRAGTDVLFVGPGYKSSSSRTNIGNNDHDIDNDHDNDNDDDGNIASIVIQQIGFWIGISFAGGIVAEIAAKAAGVFDTVPWE